MKRKKIDREFPSRELWDSRIIDRAEYFTAIRFLGVGKYERNQFSTRKEACEIAQQLSNKNNAQYIIYAVDKFELTAYVTTIRPQT